MSITRLGAGPRMSQAVIHNGLVYSAGQVGQGADITAQTRDVLANVDKWLAEAGTDKSKILSATVWIKDMAEFGEMNAVWDAWIDPKNPHRPRLHRGQSGFAGISGRGDGDCRDKIVEGRKHG